MKTRKTLFACGVFLALLFLLPTFALSQDPYYQGKTITIIQARESGGTGDMRVRALIPFLQKYIPGNPTIVSEYMTGGGGRKAANYIYKSARPDGFTIGNVGAGLVSNAILGVTGVLYDVDRLIYLGSGNSRTSYVFFTRQEVGLDSLEKLRAASGVRVGAQSVGHDNYIVGRVFAWLLDLKAPKFVTGYSGPEVDLALARGEVDARANNSDQVVQRNADWIEKKMVHFHSVVEIPKGFRLRHSAFDYLPALQDFARTDMERKVVEMMVNFRLVGSPYILPANTPKERAEILKEAFRKALKDPELAVSMRKLTGADPEPLLPEEQEKTVRDIPRDAEVIKNFKQIAGPELLPPR